MPEPPTRATVRRVSSHLWSVYGERARPEEIPLRDDPLDSLIRTILSQNTTDVNADRAYAALREAYPKWDRALAAAPEEIERLVRPAGLAEQKGPRIQGALRAARERSGSLDLSFLREMPVEAARAWLVSLEGVGPKTAACVLLFSLGMPAFPVDTHCLRIGQRLGWIPPRMSADRAHPLMDALVPDKLKLELHLGMIRHGRACCRPRNPGCDGCPVRADCTFPR
jgi:endonuclease III